MTGPDGSAAPVPAATNPARVTTIARRLTGGDTLPSWFSNGLYAALIWCVAAGVTALAMLSKTTYSPIVCTIVATVATVAAWPFRPRSLAGDGAHGPAAAALVIALALLALAGGSHSNHIFTDRDPAVYINTGRSIARTHRVHPTIAASPFDNIHNFSNQVAGFQVAGHTLISSFLDFLPALLALGWSAGGDTGLLLVPALLGGLALLALYALASTIVGPRWALLGPVLLTLAPLESWFARDAYAELPLELLALGGIWLFIEARRDGGLVAGAIAGIVVGSTTFVRIDALAILVAIPAALTVEGLRATALEPGARRRRRQAIWSFAAALAVTALAGLYVSRRLTPGYVTNLHHNLRQLELAFGAGILVAIGIFVVHRVHAGIGHRLAQSDIFLTLVGVLTVAVSIYAYKIRPRTGNPPPHATPVLTPAERKAIDAFFFSASFRWFAWYLGTFTLVLIVVGVIVLGVRAARTDSPAFIVLAAAVPVTVFYIARPSVSPDHLWAMRRYLPIALPVMTIAATAAAIWSTSTIGRWQPRLRTASVVVMIGAMVVPAAAAGRPLIHAQTQSGALAAVHRVCRAAGADAAIAVEPYALLGRELPQTLRGFCGVPSAGLEPDSTTPLSTYAAKWKAMGRQFYVASAVQRAVLDAASNAVEVAHVVVPDTREPERSLGRPADAYAPRRVELWLYRVDPD